MTRTLARRARLVEQAHFPYAREFVFKIAVYSTRRV